MREYRTDKFPLGVVMQVDLIIHSAQQLLTLSGGPQRGDQLGNLELIEAGAVAVLDQKVVAVGPNQAIRGSHTANLVIDATGCVVMPGFVDPHTHIVWTGDRAAEFEQRIAGATYMEIMAAGGGIMSTVRQTRKASVTQMVKETHNRAWRMISNGTTTAEAKTGYGLEFTTEIKMLQAILQLNKWGPLELIPTFLAAHAIPEEYTDHSLAYTELISNEMLPTLLDWWMEHYPSRKLPFVDVFCENGAFDLEESRIILTKAKNLGFPLKIHADEFDGLGGTGLAVELGAVSADHLVETPSEDIAALGRSNTVAVALPCTPFGLAEAKYTPAKRILSAGGILALASDLNPGTAWCESMQFVIALACRYLRLTPAQGISAATINAAAAIGLDDRVGSLEAGKQADMIVLDIPDYRHLGYRFGTNLVSTVIKKGKIVFERSGKREKWT
jgi:imidazolonepropionase